MAFKTMCEGCGSWHVPGEPHWKPGDPCSRKCTDCQGDDHHWMEDCDDETGDPVMVCKHCPATRPMTEADLEAMA